MSSARLITYAISRRIPDWARLLLPILLGGLLIAVITHIMYFGGKRESLSAQAESTMIRWALDFAAEPAVNASSKVVTISVLDGDLPSLELAPHSQLVDASIKEYAAVVEHVAASNPEWIVVSWLTYAHPLTPEHLKPLTDVIDRLQLNKKTTIAVNLYASGTIPAEFSKTYNIVEARDCYYDVNSFCTVVPDWTWMPQQVINRFFAGERGVVSTNLPHVLPNILLNLPVSSSLIQHSFLDLRPPVMSDIPQGAIVFIGNNTSQSLHFRDNKDALQRTYIASSNPRRTLLKDGIPWHIFWADMAEMFIERRTISVVPEKICDAIIVFLAIAIVFAIKRIGGAALAPFFVAALSLPLVNMLLVRYAKLYMPVSPMIISGLVVFTAVIFISVARSNYNKWRLKAAHDLADSTADIKQNFIHLISHNLNTPIAQLRGLLEILASQNPKDTGISRATVLLEYIRITVRAVLNTSTMAEQPLDPKDIPVRVFMREFLDNEGGFFRRTGVEITLKPDVEDEDLGEIWFYRFNLDPEFTQACILFALTLVGVRANANEIQCDLKPVNSEPADPRGLIVSMRALLGDPSPKLRDTQFIIEAMSRFINMAAARGIVVADIKPDCVTLTFPA